jgi:hypothetical protein
MAYCEFFETSIGICTIAWREDGEKPAVVQLRLGGFAAAGGRATKERLLEFEHARFPQSQFNG